MRYLNIAGRWPLCVRCRDPHPRHSLWAGIFKAVYIETGAQFKQLVSCMQTRAGDDPVSFFDWCKVVAISEYVYVFVTPLLLLTRMLMHEVFFGGGVEGCEAFGFPC